MRILVTGASGFIGRALVAHLVAAGHEVVGAIRRGAVPPPGARAAIVPDLRGDYDWRDATAGMEAVVHLAGRAHVTSEALADPLALCRRINVDSTRRLAAAAREAGVRRFVFISTVKVHGEATPQRPFVEDDAPAPADAYAVSKWEGEQAVRDVTRAGGMEHVVLRPPLVYGPGVKANFLRLMEACDSGLPLPFGALQNRRSLIGLGNLVDVIALCLAAPAAANRTYLVRDPEDPTVRDLVAGIAAALGRPARLVPVPESAFRVLGAALGQSDAMARLIDPLRIDDSAIRRELGWAPPNAFAAEIAAAAAWFRAQQARKKAAAAAPGRAETEAPTPGPGRISAVMVSYHTGPVLQASIARLLAEPEIGELIVVDNGNDATARESLAALERGDARVRVISGHGNVGFAAGCNVGASYATLPFLLLINPDCLVQPGSLGELLAAQARWRGPWIATPRMIDPDGHEQRGSRRNHATPVHCLIEALPLSERLRAARWLDRVNLHERPLPRGPAAVPAISGAFMLMTMATFDRLGGMDEGYFLHFEDLDFCLRLEHAGGAAYFVPHLTCTHYQGSSAASPLAVERYKARGLRRYFLAHFADSCPRPVLLAIWAVLTGGMLAKGLLRLLVSEMPARPAKRFHPAR